jgi:hypothetical protein
MATSETSKPAIVLLLSTQCLVSFIAFAPGRAHQQVADRTIQSTSSSGVSAHSSEDSTVVRGRQLSRVPAGGER